MAHPMFRSLYRLLLYLHPPLFRKRFAEEMLWIFDEAAETQGVLRLFADAFVSLLREWVVRPESLHTPLAAAVSAQPAGASAFFGWRHFEVAQYSLPLYRWMQGGGMSLGLLSAVWLMAGISGRAPMMLADSTALRGSKAEWALAAQGSPRPLSAFIPGGTGAAGYADSGLPEESRARQLRQQERALQAAIEGRNVPGSIVLMSSGTAVVETPKTPAGEQFSAWLQALNGGDRAQIEEILTHFKDRGDREVNGMIGLRERTGGFDLKKIEESAPLRISGLVQERNSDQFARFTMDVETETPHKIIRFDLNVIPRPAKFRIGSMNKMFTATSILQLVQAGKITLTDALGKYIPDYPNKEFASKVTIQQLLTHTGGTGDIFGPEFDAHRKELRTLQDYVNLYGKRNLEFEPGSRWEYSNYGFLLLGVVVERMSGKSYYDYVNENVYGPAGMAASGSLTEGQIVPNRSIGYTRFGGGGLQPNTDTLPYRGTSAGGGYATVEDLVRFANAVTNHKVLDA